MHARSTPARRSLQGFTLVEMMTVVILVGVLATLATYGVRKYILSAKSGEAVTMMTSIRSAEEAFKGETFIYLDVSGSFQPDRWYPSATPGLVKVQWGGPHPTLANWNTLGVFPDAPVVFSYAVVAVAPGNDIPNVPTVKKNAEYGAALTGSASRWTYIAAGRADLGGNAGVYTTVLSHSLSAEVYVENEGE